MENKKANYSSLKNRVLLFNSVMKTDMTTNRIIIKYHIIELISQLKLKYKDKLTSL